MIIELTNQQLADLHEALATAAGYDLMRAAEVAHAPAVAAGYTAAADRAINLDVLIAQPSTRP